MKDVKRSFIQRIFGIPATKPPLNADCWSYKDGIMEVDLTKATELQAVGGGLGLESPDMPKRVLIVRGAGDAWFAFENSCRHGHRRLDPVPGEERVQCCSMGKTKYDFTGKPYSETVKECLPMFPVEEKDGRLIVKIGYVNTEV